MPQQAPNVPARFDDPLNFVSRLMTKLFSLWIGATYPFASVGRDLSVHYTTILSRRMAPAIKIGNSVMIRKDAWINTFDISEGEAGPKIIIDDNCLIGGGDIISAKNRIHIESDVIIGKYVLLQDHNHAYEDVNKPIREQGLTSGGKIRIEQGCWIGHSVAIVCNQGELVIGRNSVVAANALVTRSFPPNSVIVGNPARTARQFDHVKGIWVGATGRTLQVDEKGSG